MWATVNLLPEWRAQWGSSIHSLPDLWSFLGCLYVPSACTQNPHCWEFCKSCRNLQIPVGRQLVWRLASCKLHTRPITFYFPFGPVAKPPLHFWVCNSCFLIRALLSPGLLYFGFFGTMLYLKKKSQLRTICTFRSRTRSEFFLLIHLNLDLMDFLSCRGILELSALPNFQLARNIEWTVGRVLICIFKYHPEYVSCLRKSSIFQDILSLVYF